VTARRRAEVLSASFLAAHLGSSQVVRYHLSFTSLSSSSGSLLKGEVVIAVGWGRVAEGRERGDRAAHHFPTGVFVLRSLLFSQGTTCHILAHLCFYVVCFLLQNSTHRSACCQGASHCIWHWKERIIISPAFICSYPKQGLAHHCTNT